MIAMAYMSGGTIPVEFPDENEIGEEYRGMTVGVHYRIDGGKFTVLEVGGTGLAGRSREHAAMAIEMRLGLRR